MNLGTRRCGRPVPDVLWGDVFEPDVWWVGERRKLGRDDQYFGGPPHIPDLAVEVLSPSTRRTDLGLKRMPYEQAGLSELWVIDPEALTATIWRRSAAAAPAFDVALELERGDVLGSPQLPDFAARLADLVL